MRSQQNPKEIAKTRWATPSFRPSPVLQKYYLQEASTGEYSGIYVWDSEESLKSFRSSELARTIPLAYQAAGQPA